MKIYKKILFKLLYILPISALAIIAIWAIFFEITFIKPIEVSKEEFTNLISEHHIDKFNTEKGYVYILKLDNGKKYKHTFKSSKELVEYNRILIDITGGYSSSNEKQKKEYYIKISSAILTLALVIFIFYITVVLWLFSLFDLLKSEFKETHNKWMWFIGIIILPFIFPLYYLLISEKQKISPVSGS